MFNVADECLDEAELGSMESPSPNEESRRNAHRQAVGSHPLVCLAHAYMNRARDWLKTADKDLKTVADGLLEAARSKFSVGDPEEEAREIGELIEVVTWYHTLIPPKMARAIGGLPGRQDDTRHECVAASRLEDANGSGKVVLAAIEHSCAAWLRLREIVPSCEDEILPMLAMLSRLRRGIEAALPGAKIFLRPGFDTEK